MDGSAKIQLITVCGPTASGKTALAVGLAKHLGGEVISADSMQIYRGLDIGTAKVTPQEMQGVPHHLIDIRDPDQLFSVAEYTQLASRKIHELKEKGAFPVLCGGTGLYISSLLQGVRFAGERTDPALRRQLKAELEALGPQGMHKQLAEIDPEYAASLHPNDTNRVLRGLELYRQSGMRMSQQLAQSRLQESLYDPLILCLTFRDRAALYERINRRVDAMMAQGLLEEAAFVYQNRERFVTAAKAIGYKEFFPFFEEGIPLEQCTEKLKQASRNYAKRQITWFKRMKGACFVYMDEQDPDRQIQYYMEKYGIS